MNQISANGYVAVLQTGGGNTWQITGANGQAYYQQGSASEITTFMMKLNPGTNPVGTLLPSANVSPLPDGSTTVESMQRESQARSVRRANLEPDYVTAYEQSQLSNSAAGLTQLYVLQADVANWNASVNNLRAAQGMTALPPSAFDGSAPIAAPTTFQTLQQDAMPIIVIGGLLALGIFAATRKH